MTYPVFFRKKVLAYREKHHLTIKEVAVHFNIGSATVSRWVGKLEPETTRVKPALKIPDDVLRADVEKYPDDFQYERAARLGVSESGIWHALRRLKISYKKNAKPSQGVRRKTRSI